MGTDSFANISDGVIRDVRGYHVSCVGEDISQQIEKNRHATTLPLPLQTGHDTIHLQTVLGLDLQKQRFLENTRRYQR